MIRHYCHLRYSTFNLDGGTTHHWTLINISGPYEEMVGWPWLMTQYKTYLPAYNPRNNNTKHYTECAILSCTVNMSNCQIQNCEVSNHSQAVTSPVCFIVFRQQWVPAVTMCRPLAVLAHEPDNLSSLPRSHKVARELSSDLHMCVMAWSQLHNK